MRILIFASDFLDEGADTDPEFKSLRPNGDHENPPPPPFPSPYGAILGGVQVQMASHQHASPGYSIYSHATQQPGYVRSHARSDIKR